MARLGIVAGHLRKEQEYEQLPAEHKERLESQAAEQMAQYAEAAQTYVGDAAQAPKAAKATKEALEQRAGPVTPEQSAQHPAQ